MPPATTAQPWRFACLRTACQPTAPNLSGQHTNCARHNAAVKAPLMFGPHAHRAQRSPFSKRFHSPYTAAQTGSAGAHCCNGACVDSPHPSLTHTPTEEHTSQAKQQPCLLFTPSLSTFDPGCGTNFQQRQYHHTNRTWHTRLPLSSTRHGL